MHISTFFQHPPPSSKSKCAKPRRGTQGSCSHKPFAGFTGLKSLSTETRTEYDTFGPLEVPNDRCAIPLLSAMQAVGYLKCADCIVTWKSLRDVYHRCKAVAQANSASLRSGGGGGANLFVPPTRMALDVASEHLSSQPGRSAVSLLALLLSFQCCAVFAPSVP